MGYFLFYESMLDCVLFARDKWLVKDGVLLPDKFVLKVAGCEDENLVWEKQDFWENVYGVKMDCIKPWVLHEPIVDQLPQKQIITNNVTIYVKSLFTFLIFQGN